MGSITEEVVWYHITIIHVKVLLGNTRAVLGYTNDKEGSYRYDEIYWGE